jgi:hypothetical protein
MSEELCPNCNGPLWVPPHPQAGYQASIICDCDEVGRRDVKARIAWAKRAGRWADSPTQDTTEGEAT